MRRRLLLITLALIAPIAAAAIAPSADAATWRRCAPVRDIGPTGMDPADGVRIRALRTGCRTARRVVKRYTRAAVTHFDQDVVRVLRWRCTNSYPRVRCSASGGKRIRFRNDG
jgi:hypothetical protein